jgi:tRNA pseudouridine55 synthase
MAKEHIDGVLLLDKPLGISSAAAVARTRRCFNAEKAGHTGTLDPLASGLLPLCLGEATKFASDLLDADKGYLASVQLGVTTTTGDAEGEVLERRPVLSDALAIEQAMATLRGPISQVPPMYSALKRDGRPLYSYARAGISLEREARAVSIHEFELLEWSGDELRVRIECSKGTYVRVLAEDLGQLLGCGAHLSALRRTRVGAFRLDDAIALGALEATEPGERHHYLRALDTLVQGCARLELDALAAARFCQGQRLALERGRGVGRVRVYALAAPARFLGLGELDEEGVLHPRRLVAARIETY